MPLEDTLPPASERVLELNARYRHHAAADVLAHALTDPLIGPVALVSSFGAESVVLLHMVATHDRTTPVLFLNTEMLFEETLEYQVDVSNRLNLTDVRILNPDRSDVLTKDVDGLLHLADTDACCHLRKVKPLQRALDPFDAWITGRKRFHGGARTQLDFFEAEGDRIKINPLAHWTRENVSDYIDNNLLPRHPLVRRGFLSVGCAPCTSQVSNPEDPRSGRWAGQDKSECGIHFINGRPVQGPQPQEDFL